MLAPIRNKKARLSDGIGQIRREARVISNVAHQFSNFGFSFGLLYIGFGIEFKSLNKGRVVRRLTADAVLQALDRMDRVGIKAVCSLIGQAGIIAPSATAQLLLAL